MVYIEFTNRERSVMIRRKGSKDYMFEKKKKKKRGFCIESRNGGI